MESTARPVAVAPADDTKRKGKRRRMARRPMSSTARYLVSAAAEARDGSIAAAEARYQDRLRHAAQLDGVPLDGGDVGVDEQGNWTAEVLDELAGDDCGCSGV